MCKRVLIHFWKAPWIAFKIGLVTSLDYHICCSIIVLCYLCPAAVVWGSSRVQQAWPEVLPSHANAATNQVPSPHISHFQEDNRSSHNSKARPDSRLRDTRITMHVKDMFLVCGGWSLSVVVVCVGLHQLHDWAKPPRMYKSIGQECQYLDHTCMKWQCLWLLSVDLSVCHSLTNSLSLSLSLPPSSLSFHPVAWDPWVCWPGE